jgi:hypothetical protein
VAGTEDYRPNIRLAALIIIEHQWRVSQQALGRGPASDFETRPTGSGWAVPNRALQLLEPHEQAGGFA